MAQNLRDTLKSFLLSRKAGVGSLKQLAFELERIRKKSGRVLIVCIATLVVILGVTLYLSLSQDEFSHITAVLAADGVILVGLVELMRRAYRDTIGASYLISIVAVSSEAQVASMIAAILKTHFAERLE